MQGVYLKFSSHFEKFVCDGESFLSNSNFALVGIISFKSGLPSSSE